VREGGLGRGHAGSEAGEVCWCWGKGWHVECGAGQVCVVGVEQGVCLGGGDSQCIAGEGAILDLQSWHVSCKVRLTHLGWGNHHGKSRR
jgi:hypothetical protein